MLDLSDLNVVIKKSKKLKEINVVKRLAGFAGGEECINDIIEFLKSYKTIAKEMNRFENGDC